jgi:hypothetical protein
LGLVFGFLFFELGGHADDELGPAGDLVGVGAVTVVAVGAGHRVTSSRPGKARLNAP